MNFARQTFIWFLRVVVACLLLMAVFMGLVYVVLQRDPGGVAKNYLSEITRRSGLRFDFGGIDVTLLPLPTLSISDLNIKGDNLDFNAGWVSIRPDMALLLKGEIFPRKITILRPKLQASCDLPLEDPQALVRAFTARDKSENEDKKEKRAELDALFPAACVIEVSQGEALAHGRGNSILSLNAVKCFLDLDRDASLKGSMQFAALRMGRPNDTIFNLEKFAISGDVNFSKFFLDTPELKTYGIIRYKNVISTGSFNVDFASSPLDWKGVFDLNADLDLHGAIVPAQISGGAMRMDRGARIRFSGVKWSLGADSGSLDAILQLPRKDREFSLSGTFLAHRVSLTEWLGFARNLPPGLQLSLDNIFGASVEFELTSKGLQAPKVSATCVGSQFSGSGSVADFSKPVIALNMRTESANLGLSIPESLGVTPIPVYFAHPALTPEEASPLKPGETGIGYDIRLAADIVKYGAVKINKGSLRIHPGKMDKSGLEDVLLSGKGVFYGGPVTGECILGADPSLPYSIVMNAKGIKGAALAKDMPLLPIASGTLRASANVMSKSKKLDEFLENLRGSVEAGGEKVALKTAGTNQIFNTFTFKSVLKGAELNKNRLGMNGQWQTSVKTADWDGDLRLDGKLWFGGQKEELSFSGLPGTVKFIMNNPPADLPKGSKGEISGKISAKSGSGEVSIKDGNYEFAKISGKLNAAIDANSRPPQWKGTFSGATANLPETMVLLGVRNSFVPASWRELRISAAFSGNPDIIRLTDIKAKAGGLSLNGRMSCEKKGNKPYLDFAINADSLDMGEFGGKDEENDSRNKAWNFTVLQSFNAKGEIGAKSLKGWKVNIQNAKIPLVLKDGHLALGPVNGRLYGAPLHLRANIDFRKGLGLNCAMSAHNFDLEAASRAMGIESILTGKASLDANLRSSITEKSQLASSLNGDWSISIRNGSWQGKKNGKPQGKPTRFSLASASGSANNGILKSNNINLNASDMHVTGKGWLNLPEEKIDCDFNINMRGLPDIPMRLYGKLDKTKTSIGAGKMVINTITGITNGVVDVFGGIIEGAWKIFR